ncbi:MAG: pirin family protein [Acidobacteria bacterium]|nr:pirin family protein [Acidobacteriota bacterium]
MLTIRNANERGHTQAGWLNARHSFSFNTYYDPKHMGFRSLRVINDDRIAPGTGFGRHPHRDMEIITWVLEGQLEHEDSMGNRAVLRPGQMQRMSAGTGIYHSERNASSTEPIHLFQIWIQPDTEGIAPRFEDLPLTDADLRNKLFLAASPDGRNGSSVIQQSTFVYASKLDANQSVDHPLEGNRHAWLQVATGRVNVNGHDLGAGDAIAASDQQQLHIQAAADSAILLFDLA